jgi:sialate O-acetylesterase
MKSLFTEGTDMFKNVLIVAVTLFLVSGCAQTPPSYSSVPTIVPAPIFRDHMVLQRDIQAAVWGTATPGERVSVNLNGQKASTTADAAGKWMVRLPKMKAGGPYQMTLTGKSLININDVYVGEVWICSGQSNMAMTVAKENRYWCGVNNEAEEVAAADYPQIRFFDVDVKMTTDPVADANGTWRICSPKTIGGRSATAYFFGRDLYKNLNVPIGLVVTSYGASTAEAWTSRPALTENKKLKFLVDKFDKACKDFESGAAQQEYKTTLADWESAAAKAKAEGKKEPKKPGAPKDPRNDQHSATVLYNAMISPLVPYGIRGAIWYQGESNSPTADVYEEIMANLIANWRTVWGEGNFPFLYVQLANYGKAQTEPQSHISAETKKYEAQLHNLSIPNTGMAVAIDIGDANNIHPKNKQEIGRRLSLIAEALVYGRRVEYSGPTFEKMYKKGNSIVLQFGHVGGGLTTRGGNGKLTGFAIAGEDRKFVWADAKIQGDTIIVSSPTVEKPVAVRYGWDKNPIVSLYNEAGLPASPFRTDKWE